jgi:hypothetical protein
MKKSKFDQERFQNWAKFSVTCFVFVGTFWLATNESEVNPEQFHRQPASQIEANAMFNKIQSLKKEIADPNTYNAKTCVSYLSEEYRKVFELRPDTLDQSSVTQSARILLEELFALRMDLRRRYILLAQQSELNKSCAFAHRKAFRAMRVMEDYLGEASMNFPYNFYLDQKEQILKGTAHETVIPAFGAADTNILWNPKYQSSNGAYIPQSGDLILSRGNASTSAAISRITDEDSNFSHLSTVYRNPQTNRLETIEAHIEIGSNIFDYEKEYVNDNKVRAAVFRLKNPKLSEDENQKLANKAAEAIHSYVKDYQTKNRKNICYNFTMDMKVDSCLFCSQIISFSYKLIGSDLNVPQFQSTILPKNTAFLEMMGVTARQTFAPADIELDPRFELVAEWRDYNRIHHAHHLDAILTAMYKWMDEKSYRLQPSLLQEIKGKFGYILRRIPILESVSGFDEKFPLNMPVKTIKGVQALNSVTNALKAYLEDEETTLGGIRRLSPKEMLEKLEILREKDYQDWQARLANPLAKSELNPQYSFHSYFKPKN